VKRWCSRHRLFPLFLDGVEPLLEILQVALVAMSKKELISCRPQGVLPFSSGGRGQGSCVKTPLPPFYQLGYEQSSALDSSLLLSDFLRLAAKSFWWDFLPPPGTMKPVLLAVPLLRAAAGPQPKTPQEASFLRRFMSIFPSFAPSSRKPLISLLFKSIGGVFS